MCMHTDVKYTNDGTFRDGINTQKNNTVTLIFTIGHDRYLKWQRHEMNKNKKWSIDSNFSLLMLLKNGNFVILHPHDECPHGHLVSNIKCKYHHGVRVIKKIQVYILYSVCQQVMPCLEMLTILLLIMVF